MEKKEPERKYTLEEIEKAVSRLESSLNEIQQDQADTQVEIWYQKEVIEEKKTQEYRSELDRILSILKKQQTQIMKLRADTYSLSHMFSELSLQVYRQEKQIESIKRNNGKNNPNVKKQE